MRAIPFLALTMMGCPSTGSDGTTVIGDLGGEAFNPDTVVFDVYGAGPEDSAAPDDQQFMLVFADAPDACPLLGPLFHYWWLRCESACEGLLANQDLWPDGELRMLWVGITVDQDLEDAYTLANDDGPGLFTTTYRPVDLSRLEGLDQTGCFDACTADYGFLLTEQSRANVGDLELRGYSDELLEGELDVLLSEGEVQARFDAPQCDMGLHGP